MADSRAREIVKLAEANGWTKVRFEAGTPHCRLIGRVEGEMVEIVVSMTKAVATPHNKRCLCKTIRRAAETARNKRAPS